MPALARRRLTEAARGARRGLAARAPAGGRAIPPIDASEPALRAGAAARRADPARLPRSTRRRVRLPATAFVFDMNKVFEDFVTTALRESMVRFGGELRAQWRGRLDVERRLEIIPDLTWWIQGRLRGGRRREVQGARAEWNAKRRRLPDARLLHGADAGSRLPRLRKGCRRAGENPPCAELDRRIRGSHSGCRSGA